MDEHNDMIVINPLLKKSDIIDIDYLGKSKMLGR